MDKARQRCMLLVGFYFGVDEMSFECDEWNETTPPVGTRCEAMHLPNLSVPVECIVLDWKSLAIESPAGWSVLPILHGTKFRKIRKGREKFIEQAMASAGDYHKLEDILGDLFDAGFRAPEKIRAEREFAIKAAAKEFYDKCIQDYSGNSFLNGLGALYDAGMLRLPESK